MPETTVILTDVARDLWVERWRLSADDAPDLCGTSDWSVSKWMLRGGRSEGVDVVEIDNGTFSVKILPTRGMGIWRGRCRGVDVGWQSPVRFPVNPQFVNLQERGGLGWLGGFNEFLCRCGLASNGAPGVDVVADDKGNRVGTELTLHGKIANTPAHYVEACVSSEQGGLFRVTGVVDETMMFGPCLRLTSTLETTAGSPSIRIIDEITNLGGQPAEMELLYHTNVGRPFLDEGASFSAPIAVVAPRDARAAEGSDDFARFSGPRVGYREQVYLMELRGDSAGQTVALLRDAAGERGLSLEFSTHQLPYFSLWKNTQAEADGYVTGLEPATNFPNLKTFERQQGRVVRLEPGASYRSQLTISVHATKDQVAEVESRIVGLQGGRSPDFHQEPYAEYTG